MKCEEMPEWRNFSKKRKIQHDSDSESSESAEDEESIFDRVENNREPHTTPLTPRSRSPSLPNHSRTQFKSLSLTCEKCDKTFHRRDRFNRHNLQYHSTSRDFKCDWPGCSKDFASKELLNRHRKTHEQPNKHYCPTFPRCTQCFRKKSTMQRHFDLEHAEQPVQQLAYHYCTEINPTTGQKCESRFSNPTRLKQHIQKGHENKVFWCATCIDDAEDESTADAVKFTTWAALRTHQSDIHPPICSQCHMKFLDRGSLAKHETTHQTSVIERKKWSCPVSTCDKSFTTRSNLNNHQRKSHNPGKRFICGEEDLSTFADVQIWDGVDACGSSYAHKVSLVNHVRTHHLGIDQRGYRRRERKERAKRTIASVLAQGNSALPDGESINCIFPDCSRIFHRTYDLGSHLQGSHGLEEEEIEEALNEQDALNGGPFWVGGSDHEGLLSGTVFTKLRGEDDVGHYEHALIDRDTFDPIQLS